MTIQETMEALDVSRQTVLRLVKDGKLTNVAPFNPSLKLQRVRFAREQVDAMRPRPRDPNAPPDVVTDYAVTVHTPVVVAAVERLLVEDRAPYSPD